MSSLFQNLWYKLISFNKDKDDYNDDDCDDYSKCEHEDEWNNGDDAICTILLYIDADKNVSFNYSFREDSIEHFAELFVNMTTGSYSESLYKMIIEQMINRDMGVAKIFTEKCATKMKSIMQEKTKNANDPVISPLMAFTSPPSEENQ